jgi:uncharacterized membrane protein
MSLEEAKMINVIESVVIDKPLEEVYAFALDPHNIPKWQKSVLSIQGQDVPVTEGYQFVSTRKFLGREVKIPFEVREVHPQSSFTINSKDGSIKMQVEASFEQVNGGTKATTHLQAEVGGFFKVAEGAVAKQMKSQLSMDYLVLKDLLEKK